VRAMVDKTKKVWVNGELINWDDAQFPVLTHSFHYGVAAFEGVRAYKRADGRTSVFRLDAHTNRLFDTCKLAFLEPKFTREQINQGHLDLARANDMDEAYFRPMVYVGEGAMGIHAPNNPHHSLIVAWKWGAYLGQEALEKGIRCKVSSWHRHHIGVGLPKAKMTGQYTNSVLAKREAKLGGYDEAILSDVNGYMSEGSGENLFIVKNGRLITPPLSGSVLAGITRDTILTLAREDGIPVVEANITRDELYLADEAFFTGTAAEVTPIREIDDRKIGDGVPGEIGKSLQKRYFDAVRGVSTAHPEWHTFL
jgi:branched-chain amino acid aminotransferase